MKVNIDDFKQYASVFSDLSYNQTITLTSTDPPYFAVRSFKEKWGTYPLNPTGMEGDPFRDISDEGWALLEDVSSESVRNGFRELADIALAVRIGDNHYVSRFAYLLYDPQDGLIANLDQGQEVKKAWQQPFMWLFLTYVLPGIWWSAFYDRQYLSEQEGRATELNALMIAVEEQWLAIEEVYGYPGIDEEATDTKDGA
jgi:hypothetical protein